MLRCAVCAAITVIDPGWGSDATFAALERSLRMLGRRVEDIGSVIATHHHPDHIGVAERVMAASGASLTTSVEEAQLIEHLRDAPVEDEAAAALEAWGVPAARRAALVPSFSGQSTAGLPAPDRVVRDGDVLDLGGHRLRAILTPGHTSGHLCLADEDRGLLYTGDHLLPVTYPGIGLGVLPGDRPLLSYLSSLARLRRSEAVLALPGHEALFSDVGGRVDDIARHHLRRTREVSALLDADPEASVWSLAAQVTWTGGWDALAGFFLVSAVRQTALHRDLVLSGEADGMLALWGA